MHLKSARLLSLPPKSQTYPQHFRAGQRCGSFWGNHESGENKGIHHMASLPSPQLSISQLLVGCHQLEARGPTAVLQMLRIATLSGDCQGNT